LKGWLTVWVDVVLMDLMRMVDTALCATKK
jgi:hypothetical protein